MKSAFKEKEDVLLKRLDSFEEDLKRTEKWAERKQMELKDERDQLKIRLDQILLDANVDMDSFSLHPSMEVMNKDLKNSLNQIIERIESLETSPHPENPDLHISMAKAFASDGKWLEAAQHYDLATKTINDNWELYFYKGIAYANSREGKTTNLRALESYANALVYVDESTSKTMISRIFIYKGAMLKRLNRPDEAEKDILLGLDYAENQYEIDDGLYNLACIYAMKNKNNDFLVTAEKLKMRNPKKHEYLLERFKIYAPDFYSETI